MTSARRLLRHSAIDLVGAVVFSVLLLNLHVTKTGSPIHAVNGPSPGRLYPGISQSARSTLFVGMVVAGVVLLAVALVVATSIDDKAGRGALLPSARAFGLLALGGFA